MKHLKDRKNIKFQKNLGTKYQNEAFIRCLLIFQTIF